METIKRVDQLKVGDVVLGSKGSIPIEGVVKALEAPENRVTLRGPRGGTKEIWGAMQPLDKFSTWVVTSRGRWWAKNEVKVRVHVEEEW